jgi:curved DNA-binding protein CbpA
MDLPDYYALLEVDREADRMEIRLAFRRLTLTCHPDLHPGDDDLPHRFQQIVEAHDVLSDPDRRAQYDALCAGKIPAGSDAISRLTFEEWVAQYPDTR